jgi:hypothetical protein
MTLQMEDFHPEIAAAARHYLQASAAYNFAQYVMFVDVARKRALHEACVRSYTQAAPWLDPPARLFQIPYRRHLVKGWLRVPRGRGPAPVVALFHGTNGVKEELHWWAEALIERGLATLTFDGPGLGETFHRLSMVAEPRPLWNAIYQAIEAEPALDPEFPRLAEMLHRKFASHNVLLTNGFHLTDLTNVDEVVFSLKAYTNALHCDYTGKSNRQALENFVKLHKSGTRLRTESIFIPEYIDGSENEKIARFIASVDSNIPHRIDAYIPIGDNPWRRPASEEMEEAVRAARKYLQHVSCLTGNEDLKYQIRRIF